jgi:hypothetical protein
MLHMKLNAITRQLFLFFFCYSFIGSSYSQAPNHPVNPVPANQAGSVSINPNLCATVSDPNGGTLQVRYYGRKIPANGSEKFTIILLPDTQYYTEEPQGNHDGGNAAMFNAQTTWIANNRLSKNIVYVGQLGDCVQNGDDPPGSNNEIEWQRAQTAIATIENPTLTGLPQGIPFGISVGNHDQTPIATATGTTTYYNQYFGSSHFAGRDYYGGHYGSNNDNHYQLFSASGIDFMVISFEYDQSAAFSASGGPLDWAENLVQNNPGRKVIVMTHWAINEDASFSTQGQAIYNRLRAYSNFVFLMGGHVSSSTGGEAQRTDIYNGNRVHTILTDYQSRPAGGNGLLRIYEFDPSLNKVSVKTYSPYTNTFETDANSQFELAFNMLPVLGQTNTIASGTSPCFAWSNLSFNTNYEWDMELYDGQNLTLGPVWKFTTAANDIIPPTVSSVTPVDGTTSVPVSTTVTAIFNEAMDASTINNSTIELRNPSNALITAVVSFNAGTRTVTLTPSAALANSTVYTARIISGASGVKDATGNPLANDYSWSFTTVAGDITPPTVSSVTPLNGTTGVSITTTVTAIFNEAMNAATINSSTVELRNASNVLITGVVSYNAGTRTVTLTPSAALANATVYTAKIISGGPGVKDAADNSLTNDYSWSFTTVAGDITPPTVSSVTPLNGATGVSITTTVTASFNEAMNASTINSSTVELRNAYNILIAAVVSYDAGTRRVTLTPSAVLVNATVYTAKIISGTLGVKDAAGNALVNDYTWSFTTAAAASQSPVTIQGVTTKTGTTATVHSLTGVPAAALLVVATTADAVPSNCSVSSSPSLTWTKRSDAGATSSDNAEIWTAVYTAGGSITVTSNWGVESQSSVCYIVLNAESVLSGASATATLQSAPSVAITTTKDNSIIIGCTADWKAINGTTRTLRDAATERLYFRDGSYTTYHYTKAAATTGTYTEGVSLPTSQQASTALLEIRGTTVTADITPPTVSSVTPANGATGVSVNTTATAIFNEAMNAATINGSTIELRNSSNALIAAAVSYNAATRTVTLTPSPALANSTVYTAKIISGASGVKDAAGNALANDYSWSFTTAAADITPPIVSSVTPINGTTGVAVSTTVTTTFNESMNAATINSSTIELRNLSNALIASVVSYNAGTRTVTLTPSAALANSTIYTAKIISGASGVKDAAGNALASDYSWSFTTVAPTSQSPVTIQSVTTKTGTAATVHSLTGVPAGALLVLSTTADAVPSNCNVSSSPALTWTKRVDAGATSSDNAEIWTAVYAAGGSITVTSNWGAESQASVCYVVLNAEATLGGASATATLQSSPSVAITTTRDNSIIIGCTADWKAINGATRTLRDAAAERLYFKDGNYTTYHYTKAAATIAAYTEGVSVPTGQQASTALLEIRSVATATRAANPAVTAINNNSIVHSRNLGQNYPNPFKRETNIPFSISKAEKISLLLFDINGRVVKVLVNASKDAGAYTVNFDAGSLSKGIYYYRLQAGDFNAVKKLIIW